MTLHDRILLATSRRIALESIVIENPRQTQAHAVFDFLIEHGRSVGPRGEKGCVAMIAPSYSGKTTILRTYAEKLNSPELIKARKIPVLHVILNAKITIKRLAQDILEELAGYGYDTLPDSGTKDQLLARAAHFLRLADVLLLLIDEFQHLVDSENQHVIHSVADTLKRMLQRGVCPIVFSGTEKGRDPFLENKELTNRAEPPLDLSPWQSNNKAHLTMFKQFLARYFGKIEQVTGMQNMEALLNKDIAAGILDASQGILGYVCNIMRKAVQIATEAGRDHLTVDDLGIATQVMIVDKRLAKTNPFLAGLGPIRERDQE